MDMDVMVDVRMAQRMDSQTVQPPPKGILAIFMMEPGFVRAITENLPQTIL